MTKNPKPTKALLQGRTQPTSPASIWKLLVLSNSVALLVSGPALWSSIPGVCTKFCHCWITLSPCTVNCAQSFRAKLGTVSLKDVLWVSHSHEMIRFPSKYLIKSVATPWLIWKSPWASHLHNSRRHIHSCYAISRNKMLGKYLPNDDWRDQNYLSEDLNISAIIVLFLK